MKLIPHLLFIMTISACGSQTNSSVVKQESEIRKPFTPSQETLEKWAITLANTLTKISKTDSVPYDTYLSNGKPFTGWSREIFEDNMHRYRYAQYENGIMVWQIGYYESGQLDADFHLKDGKNVGSSRMWHSDGSLYIDNYFNEKGEPHGVQWSWFSNGVVSRKGLYENGKMIYDIYYDLHGDIKKSEGELPK